MKDYVKNLLKQKKEIYILKDSQEWEAIANIDYNKNDLVSFEMIFNFDDEECILITDIISRACGEVYFVVDKAEKIVAYSTIQNDKNILNFTPEEIIQNRLFEAVNREKLSDEEYIIIKANHEVIPYNAIVI